MSVGRNIDSCRQPSAKITDGITKSFCGLKIGRVIQNPTEGQSQRAKNKSLVPSVGMSGVFLTDSGLPLRHNAYEVGALDLGIGFLPSPHRTVRVPALPLCDERRATARRRQPGEPISFLWDVDSKEQQSDEWWKMRSRNSLNRYSQSRILEGSAMSCV